MKQKMIALMVVSLLCACRGNDNKPEFSGSYVKHAEGEYSIADDTLEIHEINENSYSITRTTGYQKIREGKLLPKERRHEELTATYNPQSQQLRESKRGRIITMKDGDSVLRMEASEYRRLP